MTRRLGSFSFGIPALCSIAVIGLLGLSGCPDNPYKASSWTKKLGTREHERAVQELEQLGDPSAIPDLGEAWEEGGRPVRDLQVIISLARPLPPKEAKEKFFTDYEEKGRVASWDKAMPFLVKAIQTIDDANTRSVDGATKAAEAIGESRDPNGLDALIELAHKPRKKKMLSAQIAAVKAIGKFNNEKPKAAAALIKIIESDPPPHPRTVKGKDADDTKQLKRNAEEEYANFLRMEGAAINALGELQVETAAKTLVLALYRVPELATQLRRALVASGPSAKEALKQILMGQNKDVEALFAQKDVPHPRGLGWYCGDTGELPADRCAEVSFRDFYAALVLGDFYDPSTSKQLLAALKRPPLPAYFLDDQAGPTQYNAIFDALRKIGPADAADEVRAMWLVGKGSKGPQPDLQTRMLAINAYAFVTRDMRGVKELGEIAADNGADDGLRQAAAEAFARLARSPGDIRVLEILADKYKKASAEKRKAADGAPKRKADAADKEYEAAKKRNADIKANVLKTSRDPTKSAADIRAATEAAKKADEEFKLARKKHREGTLEYKGLDNAAKAYMGFARMFQTHIARIEVAIRCKDKLDCYADTLKLTVDQVVKNMSKYIDDLDKWTKDEKLLLLDGNIERAMLELGKRGKAATKYTERMLDVLANDREKGDDRLIRQSILLALPKIAEVPCKSCEAKLQVAIKAGKGKSTLGQLNLETTMLRHYFAWAGGNKPSVQVEDE